LTIRQSDISSNKAWSGGGITNFLGVVTLNDVTIRENSGGGVYNRDGSSATFTNVTISGNSSSSGGGITNGGDVTLTNVTISGNSAQSIGGGIYNGGDVTLTNVTISDNSAQNTGGGISNDGGDMTLTNVTIISNSTDPEGAAVLDQALDGTVILQNTILAGDPTGDDCINNDGIITSIGFNLASSDNSCNIYLFRATDLRNIDPLLGPLADNGGFTLTHLPQPGSPAIDAGECLAEVPSDQRGVARPQGAACDIGAVEVQTDFSLFLPMVVH
jgi:hypothetical protein